MSGVSGGQATPAGGTTDGSGPGKNNEGPNAFAMAGVTRVLSAFRSLKDAFPWLKVAGNAALSGVLFGLETLLEMSKPCPCDPERNGGHVAVVFLVPAFILFMISLTALPDSRRLLKGWACRRLIGVEESEQEHCCRRCCCNYKRCRFTHITLLEALMPSFIWISILLIDGDHVACSFQTQADVGTDDSLDCKHICSDHPTPQLRHHCYGSWVAGSVFLVLSVVFLTILHIIPARKCGDCIQGYYKAEFDNEQDDAMEIKMEEKMKERAAERADGKAQNLMEDLKLSDPKKKDQDPQLQKDVTKESDQDPKSAEQDPKSSTSGTAAPTVKPTSPSPPSS